MVDYQCSVLTSTSPSQRPDKMYSRTPDCDITGNFNMSRTVRVPTLSASYSSKSEVSRIKREKVIQEVLHRKELPIALYYRTEASRKRKSKGKECPLEYHEASDIDSTYTDSRVSNNFNELPELFTRVNHKINNIVGCPRKVAFDVIDTPFYPQRLPNITPVTPLSRSGSGREKMSAMTIYAKGSPNISPSKTTDKEMFPKHINDMFREYWQEDGSTYKISFRQDSRGNYDPGSELHSDYYSVNRVSGQDATDKLAPEFVGRPKAVTFPPPSHTFNAMLVGTTKTLHPKHHLDDRYFSESIEELVRSGLAYHMRRQSGPLVHHSSW